MEEVTCFVREQVCPVMRGPAPLAAETGQWSEEVRETCQLCNTDRCATRLWGSVYVSGEKASVGS